MHVTSCWNTLSLMRALCSPGGRSARFGKIFLAAIVLGWLFSAQVGCAEATQQVLFIINPKAGTDDKKPVEVLVDEFFGEAQFQYEIVHTTGPHHATFLARQAALDGYDIVVAVGGDGTVHEVGMGLLNTRTALGIIPMGSGNGLARHLGIPGDPKKALEVIRDGHVRAIDTVGINDGVFFGVAGVGFDAYIAEKFSHQKQRGLASYLKLVLGEFLRYQPETYELVVDGEPMTKRAFLITFANSSQWGNDILIAPQAIIDDGWLDVAILNPVPKIPLTVGYRLLTGSIDHSQYYETFRCKELWVRGPGIQAHVDGEPILFSGDLHLQVSPLSLRVVVPD